MLDFDDKRHRNFHPKSNAILGGSAAPIPHARVRGRRCSCAVVAVVCSCYSTIVVRAIARVFRFLFGSDCSYRLHYHRRVARLVLVISVKSLAP